MVVVAVYGRAMGLFRRKTDPPLVHPEVQRAIVVHAGPDVVSKHLEGYAQIMGRNGRDLPVEVATAPSAASGDGAWTRFALPAGGMHPWEAANLAFWLCELGDVVLASGPSPTFPAHWLVRSPAGGDWLEGWTVDSTPIGLHVPMHRVVLGDDEVTVPAQPVDQLLTSLGAPALTHPAWTPQPPTVVRSEDPQRDLNPDLTDTAPNRRALSPFDFG